MKTFEKMHFGDWHVNPIVRDLTLVTVSGLLVAVSVMLVFAMLASKY